ncbi:peptidoglycan bridge formation glycyltransferase FemA/FemB family protein [Candidatus Saccharibacteria bacterium]|nr:peptidoglycan bridge formation glycyltransferase FemA/FemB family protein [Candidatus Saccharibacteria bacterium]
MIPRARFVTLLDAEDRRAWDDFVTSHPEANFLQSWDYYEFHKSRGNKIVRRIVAEIDPKNDKQTIIAAYAGVVEDAKRGRHLAIAGGPIVDWQKLNLVNLLVDDIRDQAKKHHCVFARVRPQLERSDEAYVIFKEMGFVPAPTYLSVEYAAILDLHKSEEEILKNMHRRIRYAVNNARNKGFTIEKSQDPKDIHEFYKIQLQTARRQNFVSFSEDYLTKQFAAFAKNNEAVLYTAKYNGEILAQNFMIFYGNEASYHYAVSTELGTKMSGSPILHVEAMKDARERGIYRYNLWGIVGEDEKNHRFYGVSFFKRGFGGEELKYLPAHDLVINPVAYLKTKAIEKVRKKIRHI